MTNQIHIPWQAHNFISLYHKTVCFFGSPQFSLVIKGKASNLKALFSPASYDFSTDNESGGFKETHCIFISRSSFLTPET